MAIAFLWVSVLKIDEKKADVPPSIGSSLALLKEPIFFLAVVGIFLYVGAEVCMARFLFPAMKDMGMEEATASKYGASLFFILLTIGRLGGGADPDGDQSPHLFPSLRLAGRDRQRIADDGVSELGDRRRISRPVSGSPTSGRCCSRSPWKRDPSAPAN